MKKCFNLIAVIITILILSGCVESTTKKDTTESSEASSNENEVKFNPLNDVYWGDTHLHTGLSLDAGAFGNTTGMDEAYRFAKGEEVVSSSGMKAKLSRPLDFLVITDHSDGMGIYTQIAAGEGFIMNTPEGKRWKKNDR